MVVQVVTDNASNCVSMGRLVNETYPHIFWTPCAAHCLDLLVEDVAKIPWIAEVVRTARFLVRFVTKKPRVLAMFRRQSTLDVLRPAPTRYASCNSNLILECASVDCWNLVSIYYLLFS